MGDKKLSDPIELHVPIKRGEELIEEVAIRKPRAGDLRGLELAKIMMMDASAMITLLPRLSNPPLLPAEIETDLDPIDFARLADEVVTFFVRPSDLEDLRRMQGK